MIRTPIDGLFLSLFPKAYLKKMFQGMFVATRMALEDSRQYPPPEAANFEWWAKRAKIQTLAYEVAGQVPGVTATPTRGDIVKSSWFHRRAQYGRAILTFHSAPNPEHILDDSCYARQYSFQSAQKRLIFDDEDRREELLPNDWVVYGQWLYGRGLEPRGELGFSVIRFPLKTTVGYHAARIDMFQLFPDVVAQMRRDLRDGESGQDDLDGIDFHEGEDIR
jgi:hypothetical protein